MKIFDAGDPLLDFLLVRLGVLNRGDVDLLVGTSVGLLGLDILHHKNSTIGAVHVRLVQVLDTEILSFAIRLGHFEESVNLTNCGNVVRDERSQRGLQLNVLGLVSRDVLLNVRIDVESSIVSRVVASRGRRSHTGGGCLRLRFIFTDWELIIVFLRSNLIIIIGVNHNLLIVLLVVNLRGTIHDGLTFRIHLSGSHRELTVQLVVVFRRIIQVHSSGINHVFVA